ncbi:MAG: tetratricopeptide repeat protein [Flavobacteriales bacterium]
MKKSWLFLLGILSASISFGQAGLNTDRERVKTAILLTENERYAEAISSFDALLRNNPKDGHANFYLGDCYLKRNQLDSAILIWNRGYENNLKSPEAEQLSISFLGKFRALWIAGDTSSASAMLLKAEAIQTLNGKKDKKEVRNVKMAELYRLAAGTKILSNIKDISGAIKLITKAYKLDPTNEDHNLLMGDAIYQRDLIIAKNSKEPLIATDAVAEYNQLLGVNPKNIRALYRKGLIYQATKSYDVALIEFKNMIGLDSTFAPAYRSMGQIYADKGDMKKALFYWKKYLKINDNLEARNRIALVIYSAGMYCEFLEEIEVFFAQNIATLDQTHLFIEATLRCDNKTADYQKALTLNTQILNAIPTENQTFVDLYNQAKLLKKTGQDSLSILYFDRVLPMTDSTFYIKEIAPLLTKYYYEKKDYVRAINCYSKLGSINGLGYEDAFYFGYCYYKLSDFKKADSAFSISARLNDKWTAPLYYMAICKVKLDTKNENLAFNDFLSLSALITPEVRASDPTLKKYALEAAKYLAAYYKNTNDPKNARIQFEIIYAIDPKNVDAKNELGIK